MTVQSFDIAEPFFNLDVVTAAERHQISGRAIVLNLADEPLEILDQSLPSLASVILQDVVLERVQQAAIVQGFDAHEDEAALMAQVRQAWPSAFEVRGEERLRGVQHYMSKKAWSGQVGFTFYHSASVPLKVGLHKDHPFCPVPGFREVHTQILGLGKMQQCRQQDVATLYLEEVMAPGMTHRPMFDADGNYPWHQYETITPSIFMAVELLPEGTQPPPPSPVLSRQAPSGPTPSGPTPSGVVQSHSQDRQP